MRLAFFSQRNSLKVHPGCSLLRMLTPSYCSAGAMLWCPTGCPPVKGHSSCLQLLAMRNKPAMHVRVRVCGDH